MALSTLWDLTLLTDGEDGAEDAVTDGLHKIDALLALSVNNRTQASTPGTAVNGDRYIAGSGVSGWTGERNGVAAQTYAANDVIIYKDGWIGWAPEEGVAAYVEDDDVTVRFDGTNWVWQSSVKVTTGISAAGTTEGAATQLNHGVSEVDTITASSAEAVKLPAAEANCRVTIINTHATDTLKVFPKSGDNLDGSSSAVNLTAGQVGIYTAIDATDWYSLIQ